LQHVFQSLIHPKLLPQETIMELTLSEKIQLLRKRLGLNQGQFGAKAFNTSVETGRTKIKNIELGKQKPTPEDLAQMSKVLDVPPSVFRKGQSDEPPAPVPSRQGVLVDQAVLDRFEQLGPYLEMLNRAVFINDEELIEHIAGKLSGVLVFSGTLKAINN
jgi:transcriptional regulator with XRE-family HTH domain